MAKWANEWRNKAKGGAQILIQDCRSVIGEYLLTAENRPRFHSPAKRQQRQPSTHNNR